MSYREVDTKSFALEKGTHKRARIGETHKQGGYSNKLRDGHILQLR